MGCLRITCLVLVVMIYAERLDAVTHNVGDTTGWKIPSNTSFYDDWADNNVFRVGDQLSFNWTGTHDVAVVTEAQYEDCTKVTNVSSSSPVLINLTAPGNHYYICTIDGHCQSGQKLEVEVTNSSTATPPGSPPPPSGGSNGTTPSAPPPSSASSFGPIGALCAAMSFLVFSFLG